MNEIMKKIIILTFVTALFAISINAQKSTFPGISVKQAKTLATVKRSMAFPLPTWVPAGFKVEEIVVDISAKTLIYERVFRVIYSRTQPDGTKQRFAIDTGFDGLGDLMYEPTKTIKTSVGDVTLIYEPKDEDGTILKDYVMTEWIPVGKYAFHYIGSYTRDENAETPAMISLEDTEKILKSLKRY